MYRSPEVMTANKVEKLTLTRRIEEQRIKDLLKYQDESQRLIMAIKNEDHASQAHDTNEASRQAAVSIENKKKEELEDQKQKELLRKEEIEREKKKRQMEELQKEELSREIQRICESSEELKELERNLKIAYVNKERAAQCQEALLIKKIDNAREQMIEERMELDRQTLIKQEINKTAQRRNTLVAQKSVLQEQMRENTVRITISMCIWKKQEKLTCVLPCIDSNGRGEKRGVKRQRNGR